MMNLKAVLTTTLTLIVFNEIECSFDTSHHPVNSSKDLISCIECDDILESGTTCGEDLIPSDDHGVAVCEGYCTKVIIYYADQTIGVARNCSSECEPGCDIEIGTSRCFYCCDEDWCNAAKTNTFSLSINRMALAFSLLFQYAR